MPSIEVGTVGGGTHLPAQAGCLDICGVRGASRAPGALAGRRHHHRVMFLLLLCVNIVFFHLTNITLYLEIKMSYPYTPNFFFLIFKLFILLSLCRWQLPQAGSDCRVRSSRRRAVSNGCISCQSSCKITHATQQKTSRSCPYLHGTYVRTSLSFLFSFILIWLRTFYLTYCVSVCVYMFVTACVCFEYAMLIFPIDWQQSICTFISCY